MIVEGKACIFKQGVKYPFHGKDGRAGVDGCIPDRHLAHLAAHISCPLNHLNVMALAGKINGSRETTHSRTNDDDFPGLHEAASRVWFARARKLNRIWR